VFRYSRQYFGGVFPAALVAIGCEVVTVDNI
jgi:hypothetical protein